MASDEIDLGKVLTAIRRRLWLVLLLIALGAAGGVYLSLYWLQPVYMSSATLIVIEERPELMDLDALRFGRTLTATYAQIARSRRVATAVLEMLDIEPSEAAVTSVLSNIRVQPVRDTELISIEYRAGSAGAALRGIEAWIAVFVTEINTIMNIDNVSVIDPPSRSGSPIFPRPELNGAAGGVAGLLLALMLVISIDRLDDTIRDGHDIGQVLGKPVLSRIVHSRAELGSPGREPVRRWDHAETR